MMLTQERSAQVLSMQVVGIAAMHYEPGNRPSSSLIGVLWEHHWNPPEPRQLSDWMSPEEFLAAI